MFDRLRARIYQWLHVAYADRHSDEIEPSSLTIRGGNGIGGPELCNLNIYKASGGMILEFRRNDPKKDEYDYFLHVIPDDTENVEQRMARIIQIEMMKSR
jgi:hypothetical protein